MPEYLVRLEPREPWFFGGERGVEDLRREGKNRRAGVYFIRSQDTPSQTTLFGALRYLMHKSKDWEKDADVGAESYSLQASGQTFGKIKEISPLYLLEGEDRFYVPAPMDHKKGGEKYNPYTNYLDYTTNHGDRKYPADYDGKNAFNGGWLRLDDRTIHTELFAGVERVGVNIGKSDSGGFFKKEFKSFAKDKFCFAFFIDLKEGTTKFDNQMVFLGKGRCAFRATCEECAEPKKEIHDILGGKIAYAQSPIYADNVRALYACCEFVCVQGPVYLRGFKTYYNEQSRNPTEGKRFDVGPELLQLIPAGSVFLPSSPDAFANFIKEHSEQARITGFNRVLYHGKDLSE